MIVVIAIIFFYGVWNIRACTITYKIITKSDNEADSSCVKYNMFI